MSSASRCSSRRYSGSAARGDRVRIGTIPLGGYVRISGMSPHEDLPQEVERRAYYRRAGLEARRRHRRGPGDEHPDRASCSSWGLYLFVGTATRTTRRDRSSRPPAAGVLRAGDEIVSVDGVRGGPRVLREQIRTHRCAGRPDRGLPRREAGDASCGATEACHAARQPALRRAAGTSAHGSGSPSRLDKRSYGPSQAAARASARCGASRRVTADSITRVFYDPQARKQVSGVVGSYEVDAPGDRVRHRRRRSTSWRSSRCRWRS